MNFATTKAFDRFGKLAVARWRRFAWAATIAGVMLGVTGCASGPMGGVLSKDASPEAKAAVVTKRAQERWDALLKGDVKAAYAYLSPASRAVTSLERYQARTNPANFRSVKFENVTCQSESCQLKLWLTFDHRVMKGVETPLEETWIFENGQAWYVHRE